MRKTVVTASLLILLVLCIVASPQIALQAAKEGFNVWWDYIFPVLLPMYLLIILCRALGLFHSISYVILKLFRIQTLTASQLAPFVYRWFTGSTFIANITPLPNEEKAEKTISKHDLARLYTISYNANPIFVIVIIFTAFIQLPLLGIYLVTVLILSSLLSYILLQLFSNNTVKGYKSSTSFIDELEKGRKEDSRSIGKLLGEGIYESVQQLFFVGGVMLFGSVIAAYLQTLLPMQFSFQFQFLLEQHMATYALLKSQFSFQIILICLVIVLSTGGLIQLFLIYDKFKQRALPIKTFILVRFLHATVSAVIVFASYPFLNHALDLTTVMHTFTQTPSYATTPPSAIMLFTTSLFTTSFILLCFIIIFVITRLLLSLFYKNKQA